MKKQRRALQLGIFIATATILFVVAVYLIGSKENLFSSNTNLYASFKDVGVWLLETMYGLPASMWEP